MSTWGRLALLLTAVVVFTLVVTGLFMRFAIFRPLHEQFLSQNLQRAASVAEEIVWGEAPEDVEAHFGIVLEFRKTAPKFVLDQPRFGPACIQRRLRSFTLHHCGPPERPVAIQLEKGEWLLVRHPFGVGDVPARLVWLLAIVAAIIIGCSIVIARGLARPIATSVKAMEQVADGDLSHRIPESGGKEIAEVARAFNSMTDRIRKLLRTERELMAGISHELRTPLTRMRLELELLSDSDASPSRVAALNGEVENIDRLIQEILDASRLSIEERHLAGDEVSLRSVVEEARTEVEAPQHEVVVDGPDSTIHGDRRRLVRAVSNLLSNARKYAPEKTKIEIELQRNAVTVRDRGPGVSDEDLERLFEPFYRDERARNGPATGLGLGLMIVRQIVSLHGGQISASNRPGGGLEIALQFPDQSSANDSRTS